MLSVTKAEIAARVMVSQDMLYIYRLLESLELKWSLKWNCQWYLRWTILVQ